MAYEIFPNSCRICLKRCKRIRSIFKSAEEGDEPSHKMLEILTGIVVEENDDLPQSICKHCELSLNLAFEFRNQALKSQRVIDNYCSKTDANNERQVSPVVVYKETVGLDNDVEEVNFYMYKYEDDESSEFTTIDFNPATIDASIDALDKEKFVEDDKSLCGKTIIKSDTATEDSISHHDEFLDENEVATEDLDSEKVLTKRKTESAGQFICDVCGNMFAKRGRMMDHRRRHDKALRYACEMCDQRFHLRENLRKHMFLHSGNKPFKCSFCSRTFFYESVRKAHEAVHNGHKPYICELCDKAFAYSHALKKHKLIHADIKHFHCNYCNKDFRLQHHMKQHEDTKLHQNAVRAQQEMNAL